MLHWASEVSLRKWSTKNWLGAARHCTQFSGLPVQSADHYTTMIDHWHSHVHVMLTAPWHVTHRVTSSSLYIYMSFCWSGKHSIPILVQFYILTIVNCLYSLGWCWKCCMHPFIHSYTDIIVIVPVYKWITTVSQAIHYFPCIIVERK